MKRPRWMNLPRPRGRPLRSTFARETGRRLSGGVRCWIESWTEARQENQTMTNAIVAAVKTEGNERGDHERRAGGKLRSENHEQRSTST